MFGFCLTSYTLDVNAKGILSIFKGGTKEKTKETASVSSGMLAVNRILLNHELECRGETFVTRR